MGGFRLDSECKSSEHMVMVGLVTLIAAAVLPAVHRPAAETVMPRPALVLFWASWCAPCRVELRALPEIERAVDPLPVMIVPLTDARGLPASVDRRKVLIPDGGGWRYLTALKMLPALPAAAMIDGHGDRCATYAGGVDAVRAAALVAACSSTKK